MPILFFFSAIPIITDTYLLKLRNKHLYLQYEISKLIEISTTQAPLASVLSLPIALNLVLLVFHSLTQLLSLD